LYAELSHSVPCVSRKFATEKIFPSVFNFLLPPTFSRRHLLPPVNEVDAPGSAVVKLDKNTLYHDVCMSVYLMGFRFIHVWCWVVSKSAIWVRGRD